MSERYDTRDADWPQRPWIMAAICAVAGLLLELLGDTGSNAAVSAARQAGAAFIAVAAIAFVITVEQRRWAWALAFALGWGAVVALVGWFTARYNQRHEIFEFPFLSALFAVLLAAPLFQTMRDEGGWRFPYARLHAHAWSDAVIGAAALAFVGVTFLLAWLIGGLFEIIGIDAVIDLLRESWFGWTLAGFAFGAAVGLLRERDALMATLQRLVMVVLGVLAPVLATALLLFLLSLPFTGLGELWDSRVPATPMMLLAGAGAILLANAVIGNGSDDPSTSRVLRLSSGLLVLTVLPLALIAALSLGQRIGQYGWTPERIWGVVAVLVALAYGLVGWWAVGKGREEKFDDLLRPLQTKLALGLCGLALFLALPILDFGVISAKSQLARFAAGRTPASEFDWQAMAFDFGSAGRQRLADIARSGPPEQRTLAATALKSKDRYALQLVVEDAAKFGAPALDMAVMPRGAMVPAALRASLLGNWEDKAAFCNKGGVCRVFLNEDLTRAIVFLDQCAALASAKRHGPTNGCTINPGVFELRDGRWVNVYSSTGITGALEEQAIDDDEERAMLQRETHALDRGDVEVRTVKRRQIFVGGKPSGNLFE